MARPRIGDRDGLSDAVIQLRSLIGETQQQFATRLGVAITTIARYETSRPPQGDILIQFMKLADGIGRKDLAQTFQRAIARDLGHAVPALAPSAHPELLPGEVDEVLILLKILRSPGDSDLGRLRDGWMRMTAQVREARINQDSAAVTIAGLSQEIRKRVTEGQSDVQIASELSGGWHPETVAMISAAFRQMDQLEKAKP